MTPAAGLRDGAAARSGSTKLKPKSRNVLLSLGALVLAPMAAVALALVVSPDALLHARNGIGAIVETAALRHMKEDGKTADPVEVVSWQPRAFVWRKFLSDSECEHIKQISRPYLRRSKVVDNQAGGEREDPIRTSNGTFVPRRRDDVISRVEDRVAKFTGLPVAHQEDLQVLSYGATDQYKDHMDTLGSRNEPGAGERTMSVLMYLADVDEGGETVFPKSDHWADERMKPQSASLSACARRGVSVKPRKGDALLFHDLTPTNEIDPLSMHASCPVINGLKWTATKWIHLGYFRPTQLGISDPEACRDTHEHCEGWARQGECANNQPFMLSHCLRSCCAVAPESDDFRSTCTSCSAPSAT